jgi:hypothetical protein
MNLATDDMQGHRRISGSSHYFWHGLLRRRYLTDHAHLKLVSRACSAGMEWEVFVDSSHQEGSFGGD